MDQSNDRPNILASNDEETGASSGPNHAVPLAWDFANLTLSSNCVFYNNRRAKTGIRGQAAQFGTSVNTRSHSMSTKTEKKDDICILDDVTEEEEEAAAADKDEEYKAEEGTRKVATEEETNHSRDEIIKINLTMHLIYISHCIKPDDLVHYLHCYSDEQKSDISSEKSPIRASRKALEMLLHDVEGPGRFAALRDALDRSGGYPKIVKILDGEYDPEDKNFVRIVELFAPEIIGLIKPSELLPHLLQKDVFTQGDVEEIISEEKNHGTLRAACILLMYLPKRAVDWYRSFLNVLIDCKLEDTAELLDPDYFEAIMQERKNREVRGIDCIKHSSGTPKMNKLKIPPKPKCPRPFRRDQDGAAKSPATNSDSEDEIVYTEFDDEELEYVLGNEKERTKLEESMIYIDAKILWPEKSQGEKQRILLRSLSKDEYTDACIWARKRKIWKQSVRKIFQDLFGQISVKKCAKSNVSKIISRKGKATPCPKRMYKKVDTPLQRPSPENENKDIKAAKCKDSEPEVDYPDSIKKDSCCLMACGRRIFIMKGSIVDIGVEAIVNTTNKDLSFQTGMAKTISERGGEAISAACRTFLKRQTSIDEGETFVCDGGNLPAKHVINVNSPVCRDGDEEEVKLLKQTVGRVLQQASLRNARSIALPAIGCGNSGWHVKTAAPLIISAVRNFFREEQESSLRHVYIVDIFTQTIRRFNEALRETVKDDTTCVIEP